MRTKPLTLDEHIRAEQELVEAIRRSSNRHAGAVTATLFKTLAAPLLVFLLTTLAGAYVRDYVDTTFRDSFLSLSTLVSTLLVMIAATWAAFRWSERRFGGIALMRGLGRVTRLVLQAETILEQARKSGGADRAALASVSDLTREAWESYRQALAAAGITLDDG